ncbi:polysaccharide deacetylase [Sphaerobacter thermophilus DSM 20745]|uniref:Polysaccharide deacetylase n=3 Tax=Sphaerobacter TaxID=2056 RepID=D1C6S8_SPHTD|nr:polysaccharide deacetylase [Sphaerobacter thermophilus DSM 20745]
MIRGKHDWGEEMSLHRAVPRRVSCASLVTALILALVAMGLPAQQALAAPSDVQTIYRFPTDEPVIALTFDCGSDIGYTVQILDTAKEKDVRLTFGMTGAWAQANPDLVRRMVDEGHQLINHSWDHPEFTVIGSAQRADQLRRTEDVVRSLTGYEMRPYFRPPYGSMNDSVLADLAANGYTYNIMWSVDTRGWQGRSIEAITHETLAGAAPGAIVLMHVGATSLDGLALGGIIDQLRARGYRFATIEEFVTGRIGPTVRYFPETGHWVGHGFLSYWQRFGGLRIFGYPISEEFVENGVTVQYFERARFEWHPGAAPERYDVLLGHLGREVAAGRAGEAPFQPVQGGDDANCTFYPQTGHRLCFGFRDYWRVNGGLAIFGYPISEEFVENGVTVQYFERQRFEYHPEAPPSWRVMGGLLGRQVLTMQPR